MPPFPGAPPITKEDCERLPESAEDPASAVQSVAGELPKKTTTTQSCQSPWSSSESQGDSDFMGRLKRESTRLMTGVSSTICAVDETQRVRLAMEREAISVLEDTCTASDQSDEEPPGSNSTAEQRRVASPLLLRAWGVLPWDCWGWESQGDSQGLEWPCGGDGPRGLEQPGAGACDRPWRRRLQLRCVASELYRRALLALALAALGLCMQQLVVHVQLHAGSELTALAADFPLQDCIMALGGVLGLVSLRGLALQRLLGRVDALLVRFARHERVEGKWSSVSFQQSLCTVVVWALIVAARAAAVAMQGGGAAALGVNRQTLDVGIFAFCGGLIMALAHSVLHIATGLVLMVDAFILHLTGDIPHAVRAWNTLSAVTRQVCRAMERGFLVLLTTTFALVLIVVVDPSAHGKQAQYSKLLIVLVLTAVVARLCLKAAEVTEKCARMPSLINGVIFDGKELDSSRHYLVEYIEYSATGFYVKEVRLTTATVLKAAYVGGLAIFSLLRWTAWSLP